VTLKEAARFIALHHRHHDPAQGGIVALGMFEGDDLVAVGVLGRPVSRELQRLGICECIRLCVRADLRGSGEHANCAASQLEARLRRVSQALGLTTPSRKRLAATHPTQRRVRWWTELRQQREIELRTAAIAAVSSDP
jgi:hypothetical protein